MYSADGKNKNHSGEGHAVSNIILFLVLEPDGLVAVRAAGRGRRADRLRRPDRLL